MVGVDQERTPKRHVLKRDWSTCSKFVNQHNQGGGLHECNMVPILLTFKILSRHMSARKILPFVAKISYQTHGLLKDPNSEFHVQNHANRQKLTI
jgi:hypothetical protein